MSEVKFLSGPMEIQPETGLIISKNGEIFCDYMPSGEARHEANAHLIASAPEMYDFIEDLSQNSEDTTQREEAKRLLAKARGEV